MLSHIANHQYASIIYLGRFCQLLKTKSEWSQTVIIWETKVSQKRLMNVYLIKTFYILGLIFTQRLPMPILLFAIVIFWAFLMFLDMFLAQNKSQ